MSTSVQVMAERVSGLIAHEEEEFRSHRRRSDHGSTSAIEVC
jgi:hypothetical protein